jgi:hypothetical protein
MGHRQDAGIRQMEDSSGCWASPGWIDADSICGTRTQLATLRAWKESGRIRYLGITTSREQHDEFADLMRRVFRFRAAELQRRARGQQVLPPAGTGACR